MELEVIWKRAKSDLVVRTAYGETDFVLLEHSYRVAKTADMLLQLPEVQRRLPDDAAVLASAVYHDAGRAVLAREPAANRLDLLPDDPFARAADEAARRMELALADLLPRSTLQLAARVLHAVGDRATTMVEAQILSDAQHLQEFGLLSLWATIRRGLLDGKGVQALLDSRRRKREYRFWEARLGEAFRFAGAREIARTRLVKLERFLSDLEEEHEVSDLAVLLPSPFLRSAMSH